MRKLLISMLPSASMPSVRIAPSVGQLASVMPLKSARPWAMAAAGKPIAPAGASALHACVEQQMNSIAEENYVFSTIDAGWLGNGSSTFGTQVQTQLAADATRVDGRAGSPPRGTPV